MRPDYRVWLKNKNLKDNGEQYITDAKRVEKDQGNLENHFANGTYQDIINNIKYKSASGYQTALRTYLKFLEANPIKTDEEYQKALQSSIENSFSDDPKTREERLKNADPKPKKRTVTITVYDRNPDVVAEVLIRANGVCERCHKDAPFIRKKDDTPYLEVHHIIQLANGGNDTVENAQALCPNCHREAHYGI